MDCPFCGSFQLKTLESRPKDSQVRRRKECQDCKKRFSTIEIPLDEYNCFKSIALELMRKYGK